MTLTRGELLEARAIGPEVSPIGEPLPCNSFRLSTPSSWLADAACRGKPIGWWYPERGDRFAGQVAIAVCRTCPVRRPCLDDALDVEALDGPPVGIRGGLFASQRVEVLRRRQLGGTGTARRSPSTVT